MATIINWALIHGSFTDFQEGNFSVRDLLDPQKQEPIAVSYQGRSAEILSTALSSIPILYPNIETSVSIMMPHASAKANAFRAGRLQSASCGAFKLYYPNNINNPLELEDGCVFEITNEDARQLTVTVTGILLVNTALYGGA